MPLRRLFDAVRNGISQHMFQRGNNTVNNRTIHFAICAHQVQFNLLAQLPGRLTDNTPQT